MCSSLYNHITLDTGTIESSGILCLKDIGLLVYRKKLLKSEILFYQFVIFAQIFT
jgi:hypothetical protein